MDAVIEENVAEYEAPAVQFRTDTPSTRSKILSVLALVFIAFLANIGGWLPGRVGVNMQPLSTLAPWSDENHLRETVGAEHLLGEIAIIHHTAARLRALHDEPAVSEGLLESDPSRRVVSGPRVQWISSQGLGRPGVAMPGFALLSPATWIHVILPPRWSWTMWGTVQLFLAGLGAWILAGKYVLTSGPRFVAAIVYMLCGLHVAWLHGSMSSATLWLPWCVLATLWLAAAPTLLRTAALALLLALQLAAGSAPAFIGTIATCLILLAARTGRGSFLSALFGFTLSIAIALLMTGLHWLPWWEYVSDVASIPPPTWSTPVSSQLSESVALLTAMFTLPAIALAAIAIRRRWRDRDMRLWLVILGVIGALAWFVKLLAWTQPQWTWPIVLADAGLVAGPAMALAILASIGLESMKSPQQWTISIWNPLAMSGIAAILALALLVTAASIAGAWPDSLVIASIVRLSFAIGVAAAVALLARRGRNISTRAIAAAVIADFVVFAIIANPGSGSADIFPMTPEIEYLQQQRAVRIDGPRLALPTNLAAIYGLDDIRFAGDLAPKGAVVVDSSDADPRADLIDVGYRLESKSVSDSAVPPATQPGVRQTTPVPPRAWVAQRARVLATRDDVLRETRLTPINPTEPLLDQEIAPEMERVLGDELARNPNWWNRDVRQSASAEYQRISPEEVVVRVRGGGGWLIIADQYAPGWHAYVNGRETPLVRAYGAFIAVAVPHGNIDVLLRYVPRSGQRGMYATCGGVLALLMLVSLGMLPRFSE